MQETCGAPAPFPTPSEDLLEKIPAIDFDVEPEGGWAALVSNTVGEVVASIESIDSVVIDVIGEQMKNLSIQVEEFLQSTQQLFTALVNLKQIETGTVERKKEETIAILSKLSTTMACLRKL